MELLFLLLLIVLMALALGSGYPVAFALPGSAIISILAAAVCGYLFAGNVDAYFAQGGPSQWLSAGVTNLRGVYWETERDTLIAIPLFIFMGIMLQRSKIAEDLLITMAQLFGPIRGGLGISVVFVGALLAATTGIVGATVVAMGLISLPAMLRNNYSKPLATGTIAASGTLGQIIPPSIVLIILADQLASAADQAGTTRKALYKASTGELTMPSTFDVASTSAGEMFLGAFVPGLVLVGLYMLFILIFAFFNPKAAPAVPYDGKYDRQFAIKVFLTLVPPLTLIVLVLGSIIGGIATVNQAGAIGAAGALIMAGYRLREGEKGAYTPALLALGSLAALAVLLNFHDINVKSINTTSDVWVMTLAVISVLVLIAALVWSGWRAYKTDDTMHGVMVETAKTTSLVFIILLGAAMLTAAFRAFGGEELVREFLTSLPGGFWVQFVIVMGVIFVLGFFLDFIEIAVVVVPIVAPILLADPGANITAVWLGVMIGLNIQTSFLTPPFGFALFYLRGVADASVKTLQIYKGVIAFIGLQLLALFIVAVMPPLVNYLPNRLSLLSDTAPPPRNPQLQFCMEQYIFEQLADEGGSIREAIANAKTLDLAYIPNSFGKEFKGIFDNAETALDAIPEITSAEKSIAEAEGDYRPLHHEVRAIESAVRKHEEHIKHYETALRRTRGDTDSAERERARYERLIGENKEELDKRQATIPQDWKATYDAFAKLRKTESTVRNQYRRAVDKSYEGLTDLIEVIGSADKIAEALPSIEELRQVITSQEPKPAGEAVKKVADAIGKIPGSSSVTSPLSKAARNLRSRSPDPAKAMELIEEAIAAVGTEKTWREKAETEIQPVLTSFEELTRETIGLRQQSRLPRKQALAVASCKSDHRDISLSF